jgi:hypothetical protein
MKSFTKICVILLATITLAAYTIEAQTESATPGTNTAPTAPAKPKRKVYRGKVASVDANAKTITFTMASGVSKTLQLTAKTRIKKSGEPATLADGVEGIKIYGVYHEDEDGNWVANTVNFGNPKPRVAPTNAPPAAMPQ